MARPRTKPTRAEVIQRVQRKLDITRFLLVALQRESAEIVMNRMGPAVEAYLGGCLGAARSIIFTLEKDLPASKPVIVHFVSGSLRRRGRF